MTYYPTLEEDLTRAKEILARGRPAEDEKPTWITDHHWAQLTAGRIESGDLFAVYKLLESFVDVIERMDPQVVKTMLRAQQLAEKLAESE